MNDAIPQGDAPTAEVHEAPAGISEATPGAVEAVNAQADDVLGGDGGAEDRQPSWYRHWKATGELPPDPRPDDQTLWDPDEAQAKNRRYLDELAQPAAPGIDVRAERGMRPFDEYEHERAERAQKLDDIHKWNEAALAKYRGKAERH